MAQKANAPLLALNRGEVSKIALPRVDQERLQLAAECQVNWQPFVLGAMMLRAGLQYIGGVLNDAATKLVRFFFGTGDTALLELTAAKLRIWINDALVTRASVSTAVTNGTFAAGAGWDAATGTIGGATCVITPGQCAFTTLAKGARAQLRQTLSVALGDRNVEHGLRVVVSRGPVILRLGSTQGDDDFIAQTTLDTGTHSLAFTPTGASAFLQIETRDPGLKLITAVTIDSAGALEVTTPWGASDLANIRTAQSGDIIYVWCAGFQQRKIERRSTTSWSVAVYESSNGPFGLVNTTDIRMAPSAYAGFGTLTASRAFFTANHLGALIRLFTKGQIFRASLADQNVWSPPARVAGLGALRNIQWTRSGTWVGTLTAQISFDGPDSGWVDLASTGANGTSDLYLSGTTTPSLDNQIVWYRLGFKPGDYSSGVAVVEFNYRGGGVYGIARIVGVTGDTLADIEILEHLGTTDATTEWQLSQWSAEEGWPDCGCFFEGRLWHFGRDRLWGSQSDNYVGFAEETKYGESLGDAGAILKTFGEGPIDSVNWALELSRLLAGRQGSVASIRSSANDDVVTPTSISVKDCSSQGVAALPALRIDTRGIYVQRSGRRVYELVFNPQIYDYQDHDLTRLNLDIGKNGFVALDASRQPDTEIRLVTGKGQLANLLHAPEDEVEAWWRSMTLGVIEDVCVLPGGSSEIEDRVYLVVKRTINSATKRYIEKFALRDNCVGGTDTRLSDSHKVTTGSHSTAALPHLIGETVVIWADGAYRGTATVDGSGNVALGGTYTTSVVGLGGVSATNEGTDITSVSVGTRYNGYPAEVFADGKYIGVVTVASGSVTLPNGRAASQIRAFLGLMAPFMSARLAYAARAGTALLQKKQVDNVGLIAFDMHKDALQVGQQFHVMDDMPDVERGATVAANAVHTEYDEPTFKIPGQWDTDARLCLLGQAPYPVKVGGVVVGVMINEKV